MNRPVNVLYISNKAKFAGGAPRSLFDLISNLDRDRVCPFFASIFEDELTHAISDLGVPILRLTEGYFLHPLMQVKGYKDLVRFIKQNAIDLIHNNQCSDAFFSWMPANLTHTPFIIHHRDSSIFRSGLFLVDQAAANIAISTWQNQHVLSNKGVVIHNATDLSKFPVCKPTNQKLGHDKGGVIIGLIGRIAPDKAQDVLVKAAALVLDKFENTRFLIIGDDQTQYCHEYIESVKNLVNELGIESNIEFTGAIPHIWDIIPFMDISVVPSRREPFGRTIIESMACAKPVISTNVWGALDIVTPETGILVAPNQPIALAEAIMELIQSPDRRLQMGMAGRQRVEELFTIEVMMQKVYDLYEDVLTEKVKLSY